jgi:hypothetical protein
MKISIPALAILLGWAGSAWVTPPATLTSLRAIHALTNTEASHSPAAAFEATVTYFRGYERTLFVQDAGVGVYVAATTNLQLVPGDRILIRGLVHESFRPIVESSNITLLRHGSLSEPIAADFATLVQARADCLYVTVHGVVSSAVMQLSSGRPVTQIDLRMDGG